MSKDSLRRDPEPTYFETLPEDIQKALKRAASYRALGRAVKFTPEWFDIVGQDWIMVPSKRGLRQVVMTATKCYAIS